MKHKSTLLFVFLMRNICAGHSLCKVYILHPFIVFYCTYSTVPKLLEHDDDQVSIQCIQQGGRYSRVRWGYLSKVPRVIGKMYI